VDLNITEFVDDLYKQKEQQNAMLAEDDSEPDVNGDQAQPAKDDEANSEMQGKLSNKKRKGPKRGLSATPGSAVRLPEDEAADVGEANESPRHSRRTRQKYGILDNKRNHTEENLVPAPAPEEDSEPNTSASRRTSQSSQTNTTNTEDPNGERILTRSRTLNVNADTESVSPSGPRGAGAYLLRYLSGAFGTSEVK